MLEVRYYTVTQEREVKVAANNPAEAVVIAAKAFTGETVSHVESDYGRVLSAVRERDIAAREDI